MKGNGQNQLKSLRPSLKRDREIHFGGQFLKEIFLVWRLKEDLCAMLLQPPGGPPSYTGNQLKANQGLQVLYTYFILAQSFDFKYVM
jgi:hypothetical protein